jgi:alpha-galactosidase
MRTIKDHVFQDMVLRYVRDDVDASMGMVLIPSDRLGNVVGRQEDLRQRSVEVANLPDDGVPFPASVVDPLVHVKVLAEDYPGGFAQGRTLRGAGGLRFVSQTAEDRADVRFVRTRFVHDCGLEAMHEVQWSVGAPYVTVQTTVINEGTRPVTLEAVTSFSLDGITPFDATDAAERLWIHRFRSGWSAEGRLESMPAELLGLDRSWSGHAAFSERFGQVGSIPARGFFPRVLVEDRPAGVYWGAQVCWAGSWQLELYRKHDHLCLSGGLADREFGHWMKTLVPGESLVTPMAVLTVVCGSLEDACDRLNAQMIPAAERQPAVEQELPIVFNDWCTSWGYRTHDTVVALADRLKGTPVKYFVIDAGWYGAAGQWECAQGDWEVHSTSFPGGFRATTDALRARGLIPGLWCEAEIVGRDSKAFQLTEHLLQRDGLPLTVRGRRFWNLRDPWVQDYLGQRVIQLLKDGGFGYLKLDYNETIGIGCDGDDSLGEGLRRHVEEGIYPWFDRLRSELPKLVIENCASGGHRQEPSIVSRCAMTSFSDAHETVDIPIIGANLQRLLLARQMQIWVVLRASDTSQRMVYTLAAAFLGRMCLSGDIHLLSDTQWLLVSEAMAFYREASGVIKHGQARRFGPPVLNYHHPKGWQAVMRKREGRILGVVHCFGDCSGEDVRFDVPWPGDWRVGRVLSSDEFRPVVSQGRRLTFSAKPFSAAVFMLELNASPDVCRED